MMSKRKSRFNRLGVLAPAALSACIDASVLAAPAAGAIVSTVLKELSKAFMLKKWFHGEMTAQEAEQLLMEKGKNGSYLVRESQTRPGEYVLSVRVRRRVSHVMIRREHNKYDVGSGEIFDDLAGLIEHCRAYPLTETSGDVLRLIQPVNGTKTRPRKMEGSSQPPSGQLRDSKGIEDNAAEASAKPETKALKDKGAEGNAAALPLEQAIELLKDVQGNAAALPLKQALELFEAIGDEWDDAAPTEQQDLELLEDFGAKGNAPALPLQQALKLPEDIGDKQNAAALPVEQEEVLLEDVGAEGNAAALPLQQASELPEDIGDKENAAAQIVQQEALFEDIGAEENASALPLQQAREMPENIGDETNAAASPLPPEEDLLAGYIDEGLVELAFTFASMAPLSSATVASDDEMDESFAEGFDPFYSEFQSVKDFTPPFTNIEGNRQENKPKNRFKNIIPYDQTRVVLSATYCSGNQTDYINASYIMPDWMFKQKLRHLMTLAQQFVYYEDLNASAEMGKVPLLSAKGLGPEVSTSNEVVQGKYYIATQGCLSTTIRSFWDMISKEDVRIIVMLTDLKENGKSKCIQYWPSNGKHIKFPECEVMNFGESFHPDYVARRFSVRRFDRTPQCSMVFHYQFKTWPDNEEPDESRAILRLMKDVNERMMLVCQSADAPQKRIMCVHCSAGVGRTGTFIAIDIIRDILLTKGVDVEENIDVTGIVKGLRAQRPGMVHNLTQFKFIYSAMEDYVDEAKAPVHQPYGAVGNCDHGGPFVSF